MSKRSQAKPAANLPASEVSASAGSEELATQATAELEELKAAADGAVLTAIPEGAELDFMVAEQVLIVSAPGGPRRRAGFSFGPVPVELRAEDLGDDPEAVLEALRADPLLKIDGRFEERPADDD